LQQRGAGAFQLVITDMRLPDGNGLDLLRRIDEAGRREKAIVITAYGSPENAVEALKAGAYDYLTKPVDLRQFPCGRGFGARALARRARCRRCHALPWSATHERGGPRFARTHRR
jgi:two-component system response regulator PilR (NtrC family)